MPDLIPPGQNALPPDQQPRVQPFPANVQAGSAQADPAQQAVDGADAGGPRSVGTVQDARDAQTDPSVPQTVDPQEQLMFDQFVSRFTMILSDTGQHRPDGATGLTPNAAILKSLNNPKVPLAQAIGTTTAQIAMMIVQSAQAQKVTYPPDVLFGACFECCGLVYITGNAHHIFKGVPPFRGLDADGGYDFNEFELKLLTSAQMQAVRAFGNMELKMGFISPDTRKQNVAFWQEQVQREQAAGAINDDVLSKLQSSGIFDKKPEGSAASDPTGQGPQPVAAPQSAPTPAPATPPASPQGIAAPQGA